MIILAVFSVVKGFLSGFIMQLASLTGWVCCAFFAGQAAAFICPLFAFFANMPAYVTVPLSYLLAFIVIMCLFFVIGRLLSGFIKLIRLNTLNGMAGAFFSAVKWFVLASVVLNLIVVLDRNERLIKQEIKENAVAYPYVKAIAPAFIPFFNNDLPDLRRYSE
jgi:membrane protein required for colicin V production